MERPYRYAALGAAIAAAAWLGSRLAKRLMGPEPYRPVPTSTRPVTPAVPPSPVRPPRPATPTRPVTPLPSGPEVREKLTAAAGVASRLRSAQAAADAEIAALAEGLATELHSMARPGEDAVATVVRAWRQLEAEAQRRWPGADLARRAGDLAWSAVFLADPADREHLKLADWTQHRSTTVVTNERIGTDELLVRLAAANAVMRPAGSAAFDRVIELWRRGVVPDITGTSVVCSRNGVRVADAPVRGPQGPQREVA